MKMSWGWIKAGVGGCSAAVQGEGGKNRYRGEAERTVRRTGRRVPEGREEALPKAGGRRLGREQLEGQVCREVRPSRDDGKDACGGKHDSHLRERTLHLDDEMGNALVVEDSKGSEYGSQGSVVTAEGEELLCGLVGVRVGDRIHHLRLEV
jgi:hypothetical protein